MSTATDRKLAAMTKHVENVNEHLTEVARYATPQTAVVIGAWLCEAISSLEACKVIGIELMTSERPDKFEDIATDRMNAFCSRLPDDRRDMLRDAALTVCSPLT